MKTIDNINETLKNDLIDKVKKGSRISIIASCFSMYAYKELKKQLDGVESFRFIYNEPAFVTESESKSKREFYIPQLNRENSLYGTEFEIKLRNEMTQKAIARECAEWIRKKAKFKTNITSEKMTGFMTVDGKEPFVYLPMNGFTTVDIGCGRGNNIFNMVNRLESPASVQYIQLFNMVWNDKNKMKEDCFG